MFKHVRKLSYFASLYQLNNGDYVVVHAVFTPFGGAETLVYPADKSGALTDWAEIGGVRGVLDHTAALATITQAAS